VGKENESVPKNKMEKGPVEFWAQETRARDWLETDGTKGHRRLAAEHKLLTAVREIIVVVQQRGKCSLMVEWKSSCRCVA
jgi:hypothetical protein